MPLTLIAALKNLDVDEDEQWTRKGLPDLGFLRRICDDNKILRSHVLEIDPTLNRDRVRYEAKGEKNDESSEEEKGQGRISIDDESQGQEKPSRAEIFANADLTKAKIAELSKESVEISKRMNDCRHRQAFLSREIAILDRNLKRMTGSKEKNDEVRTFLDQETKKIGELAIAKNKLEENERARQAAMDETLRHIGEKRRPKSPIDQFLASRPRQFAGMAPENVKPHVQ